MTDHFAYLVGALLFDAAWLACYLIGKRYRPQIIWGTVVTAPLALTSFLFVPQYWTPPSLFNFDARFRVGIEDFLWAGAVGGIASVVGEIVLKEKLAARRKEHRKKHYAPFIVMLVVFLILHFFYPAKNIYSTAIAFVVCAIVVAFLRSDLIPTMFVGASVFTILYFLLFVYFLALYPGFIDRYYNLSNISGIRLLGVPIEELMFAASGGAVWSVAYEYFQGYRFAPGQRFRLVEI
jgi:lycopene cyclase-like protein